MSPAVTFVPSVSTTFSTNPSTRARICTFSGESSWPMISVAMEAFVACTTMILTVGGGVLAALGFLQAMLPHNRNERTGPAATIDFTSSTRWAAIRRVQELLLECFIILLPGEGFQHFRSMLSIESSLEGWFATSWLAEAFHECFLQD